MPEEYDQKLQDYINHALTQACFSTLDPRNWI